MTFSYTAALRAAAVAFVFAAANAYAQDHKVDSASVAKGVDPTDFTSRIELRDEYQDNQGGGYTNLVVPRFEYAVSKSLSLRLEVPVVTRDKNRPGMDTDTGIGDVLTRISWRATHGEGYAVVTGTEVIFDTAAEDSLGSGKNVLGPFAYASIRLPSLHSVFFPFIEHYFTVGGDGSRPDVHWTSIKPVVLTILPNRFYTVVEPHFIVNHEINDKVGMTLEGELGRFVAKDLMVYGRPGVGLFGDDVPQVYNWNFEFGMRYLFK